MSTPTPFICTCPRCTDRESAQFAAFYGLAPAPTPELLAAQVQRFRTLNPWMESACVECGCQPRDTKHGVYCSRACEAEGVMARAYEEFQKGRRVTQ